MLVRKEFTYHFILGILVLITGMFLFINLSSPYQYLGVIFMILAYIYLARIFYTKFSGKEDDTHFRSRTRDEFLKHQLKR